MVRKIFIAAAAIGLLINFYSDISLLRQSKNSAKSGDWVNHSFAVARAIEAVRVSILQSQLKQAKNDKVDSSIKTLNEIVKDMPVQNEMAKSLTKLSASDLVAIDNNSALNILSKMAEVEDSTLKSRLKADAEINVTTETQALVANGIDLILVLLLLGIFFYEYWTNIKLRKSLAQTLMQVKESNIQLSSTLKSRDAKFKAIVHDLKNPLGVIRGFAELLFEESSDRGSVNQMATLIQRVSNDTLNLVGSVLKPTNEVMPAKEDFDLFQTISETCTFLEPVASEKNQKIQTRKTGKEFSLIAQKRKVQDVFYNLIGNAIKFSPPGSEILVECESLNNRIDIQIKDQGPGFTESDFANLFAPGKSLSAKPTGDETSTGFGLFSAKETISNLGGTIEVKNNHDKGACVRVTLSTG